MSPRHRSGVRRSSRRRFLATVGLLAGTAWQGSAAGREAAPDEPLQSPPNAAQRPSPEETTATGPAPYPRTAWRTDLDGSMYHAEPAVREGTLYLGVTTDNSPSGGAGYVAAHDAETGDRAWKRESLPAPQTPSTGAGRLYFASSVPGATDTGGLYALDAEGGATAWRRTDPLRWTDPVVTGDLVYAANRRGAYALDAATGRTVWHAEDVGGFAAGFGDGAVSRIDDTVFLSDGTALDAGDGSVRWTVDDEPLPGHPTTDGDRVYYTRTDYLSGNDGTVVVEARSPSDGRLRWTVDVGDHNRWDGRVVVDGDHVYLLVATDEQSTVTALDAGSGSVAWTRTTRARLRSSLAVADGTVYAGGWYVPPDGSESGRAVVYALDAATGQRAWTSLLDGRGLETPPTNPPAANTPVVADGRLYTATYPALATLNHHYLYYSGFFALESSTGRPDATDRLPADDTPDGC